MWRYATLYEYVWMNLTYFGGSAQRDMEKYMPGKGSLFEWIGKWNLSTSASRLT